MKTRLTLVVPLALALMVPVATLMLAAQAGRGTNAAPPRPPGPCDIFAAAGAPCVGAHSSTRALYASYNGSLYKVMRQSDGGTLDIGMVQPSADDAGDFDSPGGAQRRSYPMSLSTETTRASSSDVTF